MTKKCHMVAMLLSADDCAGDGRWDVMGFFVKKGEGWKGVHPSPS